MLTCSWSKCTDMSPFTMHVAICIQTSNLAVLNPKGSSPCGMYYDSKLTVQKACASAVIQKLSNFWNEIIIVTSMEAAPGSQ